MYNQTKNLQQCVRGVQQILVSTRFLIHIQILTRILVEAMLFHQGI